MARRCGMAQRCGLPNRQVLGKPLGLRIVGGLNAPNCYAVT
jgi:hypothetical protein